MAINNFISTVWSENLYQALDKKYIAVANCNRDFDGDIKDTGSVVRICGVGDVTVSDYTKNTDMSMPQTLSDTMCELTIDRAKYFNFQIDDIDRAQSSPKLMDAAMSNAADSIANEADKYVYSLYSQAGSIVSRTVTPENIMDALILARERLYEQNVTDSSSIVIEVSPAIASIILKAKILSSTDNTQALEAGELGSFGGCKIFVSNNIYADNTENGDMIYECMVRTRRAIAFAQQISEVTAYRPEKRFADAVKGLHLYGAKVVYPYELISLQLTVASN